MLLSVVRGQTSVILRVKILDSAQTDGRGKTGLSSASTGMIISTIADNEATATVYTVAASNVESVTTLGTFATPTTNKCRFREVDATNHKGVYELQFANARFAVSGAKSLLVSIAGASGAVECDFLISLWDLNPYDAVRAGLASLPNVASGNAGAIPTVGTGTAQISVSGGIVNADMVRISTDATAADNCEAFFDNGGFNASASAIGTAAAVTTISNGGIVAASFAANSIDAGALAASAANEIRDAIAALVVEPNGSRTLQDILRLLLSFACGVTTNGGATFKDPSGTATLIQGTVNGSNERTSITLTPSA